MRVVDTLGWDNFNPAHPADVSPRTNCPTASFHFMNSLSVNSWLETNSSLKTRVSPPCLKRNSSTKRTERRSENKGKKGCIGMFFFSELQHLGNRFTLWPMQFASCCGSNPTAVSSRSRFWCESSPRLDSVCLPQLQSLVGSCRSELVDLGRFHYVHDFSHLLTSRDRIFKALVVQVHTSPFETESCYLESVIYEQIL